MKPEPKERIGGPCRGTVTCQKKRRFVAAARPHNPNPTRFLSYSAQNLSYKYLKGRRQMFFSLCVCVCVCPVSEHYSRFALFAGGVSKRAFDGLTSVTASSSCSPNVIYLFFWNVYTLNIVSFCTRKEKEKKRKDRQSKRKNSYQLQQMGTEMTYYCDSMLGKPGKTQ